MTSGRGIRSNCPSSIIARAPSAVSSAGWNSATTATPLVPVRREVRRRAGQPGDVQVVAARVHDPVDGARVLEARLLLDRQRVHVGAQHHRRSVAVAEHADDAGAADPGRHLEPGGLQPARCDAGGAFLLHRQLRVSVEVLVEVLDVLHDLVEAERRRRG